MRKYFDGRTADGDSDAHGWYGGYGVVIVTGTFGAGTAKLQVSANGADWADVNLETKFTANGCGTFKLPANLWLRLNLSGSTDPDLDGWVG
jgi:hypothetical protein